LSKLFSPNRQFIRSRFSRAFVTTKRFPSSLAAPPTFHPCVSASIFFVLFSQFLIQSRSGNLFSPFRSFVKQKAESTNLLFANLNLWIATPVLPSHLTQPLTFPAFLRLISYFRVNLALRRGSFGCILFKGLCTSLVFSYRFLGFPPARFPQSAPEPCLGLRRPLYVSSRNHGF